MNNQVFRSSLLYFTLPPNGWGILVDPADEWENIQPFLKKQNIELRYILLTEASFKNALRIAQIKHETGAKFFSFQSDLLELRKLPALANQANVCGIKIPHVDRFLDGLEKIDLDGILVEIDTSKNVHKYVIHGQK